MTKYGHQNSANFDTFLRLQALCGAVILASWLVMWADDRPVQNVRDLFLHG